MRNRREISLLLSPFLANALTWGMYLAIFAQPLKKVKFAILPVVLVSLEFRTGDMLRFKPPEVNKYGAG